MDHGRAKELFTGFRDGDIGDEDRVALEEHLAECPECSAEWKVFTRALDEVSGLLRMNPSGDFTKAVEQKIHRRSRGRFFGRKSQFSAQFAIVSFILVLFFLLAYLVLAYTREIVLLDEDGVDAGSGTTAEETTE